MGEGWKGGEGCGEGGKGEERGWEGKGEGEVGGTEEVLGDLDLVGWIDGWVGFGLSGCVYEYELLLTDLTRRLKRKCLVASRALMLLA